MKRHPFRGICEATGKPLRDADKVLDEMEEVVGPNRREAEAALGKKLGEIGGGRFFDRKDYPAITVEELAKRFLEWAKVKPLPET